MKKWVKYSLYVLFILTLVGFVCFFAVPFNNAKTISCVGSSGVKPFIEDYAKTYLKDKNVDVNVDAGGSGFGISQVANNFTNIGTASKNPFSSVKESYKTQWIDNNIKTVTVGWEGICIVYIPPKGISQDIDLNQVLNLDENNVVDLYRTFSGFKDGLPNDKPNLALFLNNNISISNADHELFVNQTVVPYARSGGSLTSGTAASFFECCHFDYDKHKLTENQKASFENGNYGNDFKLYDTDEANSRAWSIFANNNIPGSMIYLSSSFVEQNYNLIEKNKYGILSYKNIKYKNDNIANGYNFFRPLNLSLSVNASSQTLGFIEDILSYSRTGGFAKLGAQGINQEQYASMCRQGSLWISDNELMNERGDSWDNQDTIFGAIE